MEKPIIANAFVSIGSVILRLEKVYDLGKRCLDKHGKIQFNCSSRKHSLIRQSALYDHMSFENAARCPYRITCVVIHCEGFLLVINV